MGIRTSSAPAQGTNVIKGNVDASPSANLPSNPNLGDKWVVNVAGDFDNDSSIRPANYDFTVGDRIEWDGTNWLAIDLGDDLVTHEASTTEHGISAFGSTLVDDADAPTARQTLDVPSNTEAKGFADLRNHSSQEQWYAYTIPQNQALVDPPFTSYDFLEHFKVQAAEEFHLMVQRTGDGSDKVHYASTNLNTDSQAEIQNYMADALSDLTAPNQSGDSITGTANIVDHRIIKSQFNSGSGQHEVHIFVQNNSGDRISLSSNFVIAISTNNSVTVEARHADSSTVDGFEEFSDVNPTSTPRVINFTEDQNIEDKANATAIKFAIALG